MDTKGQKRNVASWSFPAHQDVHPIHLARLQRVCVADACASLPYLISALLAHNCLICNHEKFSLVSTYWQYAEAGRFIRFVWCAAAACHTGGANVVQAEKTLQKDALVQYLDGGFKVESIVTQVRHNAH